MDVIYCGKVSFYFASNFILMGIIFYLIVISLCMAVFFLIAFFWAVKDGQYDDEYTPGMRILVDDDMIDRGENIHSTN